MSGLHSTSPIRTHTRYDDLSLETHPAEHFTLVGPVEDSPSFSLAGTGCAHSAMLGVQKTATFAGAAGGVVSVV
jgi:hypothetical protein